MICFIVGFVTEFLLVAEVVTLSTHKFHAIESNTFLQLCNDSSCKCGGKFEDSRYTMCNQSCQGPQCNVITCSSGTCFQKCHNCRMECTRHVRHCNQQCLSRACSFKCNARRCVQECNGGKCDQVIPVTCRLIIPRFYLVILAFLFAATSILSFLLLVMSFREMKSWSWKSRTGYEKLHSVSIRVEHFYSMTAEAA